MTTTKHELSVGDLVSVQTGNNSYDEIGTILEMDCEFDHLLGNDDDSDDDDDDNQVMETTVVRRDGIKVHFPVNGYKGVYAPEDVKKLNGNNSMSSPTQDNRRRTTRSLRCVVTPSPQPPSIKTPKKNGRSVATATTNTTTTDKEDKKPSAKRKRGSKDSDNEVNVSEEDDNRSDNNEDAMDTSQEESVVKRSNKKGSQTKAKGKGTLAKPLKNGTKNTKTVDAHAKEPKAKPPPKRKAKVAAKDSPTKSRHFADEEDKESKNPPESEDPSPLICLPVATSTETKARGRDAKTGVSKAAAAKKQPNLIVLSDDSEAEAGPEVRNQGNDKDEDSSDSDDDDRPFTVEYSPSSRSTCRRCDAVILKDDVRVSHVPLFRGKPGFRVYRHLACAAFTEEITQASDVSGWRKLTKADLKRLDERIVECALEREHENEELQPDELVQAAFTGEIRPPPPGLAANLLPFQVEGFSWMRHQEKGGGQVRGGILADEMGMGKTLQTIATILDNRPVLQHSKPGMKHPPSSPDLDARIAEEALWADAKESWKHEMGMLDISSKILPKNNRAGARAGTLVICPVIALHQWKSEIEKFTESNETLTIGTYHGPNRAKEMPHQMMSKYDIVLTTYQCLEQDFRKMMSPNKVSCPNCGGKFKLDKLRVHLKYFCGESAQRTEAQARQRRTADRHRNNDDRRGGTGSSGGKGKGKGNSKKPPMTSSKKPMTNAKVPTKKKLRVSGDAEYDSDSDLSLPEETVSSRRGRPTRSGVVQTKRNITKCMKDAGDGDDDESSYGTEGSDESSEDSGSSDSESDTKLSTLKKAATKRAIKSKGKNNSTKSPADRAREKQRQGLEAVKNKKGMKTTAAKKKATPAKKKKGKGKKFDSESSEDDSDGQGSKADPMANIDMDELMEEAMAGACFSILHSFCWWRVVLDEAHYIKSRSSQTAAAAFSLTGINRWCLSGTPLQNRVGELYSLIRFLRIDPMAFYFCKSKDCSCKSIHYRFKDGRCRDCGHRAFTHYAHFNRHILNAIQRDGYTGDGRRAMFKLKNEVLDKCLLRRTKETRAEDMNLPPRIVSIRTIRLHPIEEDFYNALYTQTRASFDDYVAEGTLLSNYAHIFDLLTKMRQAVDHPYLIVYSKTNGKKLAAQGAVPVANGSVDCSICNEFPTQRVVSSCCGAGFCRSCVIEYLEGAGGERTPCPSCESPFSVDLNQASSDSIDDGTLDVASGTTASAGVPSLKELSHVPSGSILRRINLAEFATSTKIEALIQELIDMRKQRPGSKALVFSQFVNMLDLIRWRLHSDPCLADLGLGVRILHGGMDVKSRDAALKDFRENSDVRILLMSLKAGGVALNLTVASEVYLVDNWWNPAAEMQAIDRTHRLGQYRPIRAVRFIAEGTVEERVLQLQEKKRLVFDGTVGRDAGSLKMLTVDDMKSLFC